MGREEKVNPRVIVAVHLLTHCRLEFVTNLFSFLDIFLLRAALLIVRINIDALYVNIQPMAIVLFRCVCCIGNSIHLTESNTAV